MRNTALTLLLLPLALSAGAKLAPLSDEAKAKAAEATAKTAWSNNVANYQLCKSMDRVAADYFAEAKKAGKPTQPPVQTPACTDPGPFAYVPPAEARPPLEASGAHSPARTAANPPSTTTPDAQANPKK
ncbi:MAG: hypothetical protein ACOZJX_10585 [Pseudomonadota bacterium]